MARLGPWDAQRRVALAVSGGADSMALALLTAAWGQPTAFIVDHGLRTSSATEAEETRTALAARHIPAQVLTLTGLQPGPGMPARARAARYRALDQAVAAAGLVDLLLGHHAGDQAETVLMRRAQNSGPRGLAGMASVTDGLFGPPPASPARHRPRPASARPCTPSDKAGWKTPPIMTFAIPVPGCARRRTRRTSPWPKPPPKHACATLRMRAVADILADRVSFFPEGYALITPGAIDPAALACVLQAVGGHDYKPSPASVAPLAAALRPRQSVACASYPTAEARTGCWCGKRRPLRDRCLRKPALLGMDATG